MNAGDIIDYIHDSAARAAERGLRLSRVELGPAAYEALREHVQAYSRYEPPPSQGFVTLDDGSRIYAPSYESIEEWEARRRNTPIACYTDHGQVAVALNAALGDGIAMKLAP